MLSSCHFMCRKFFCNRRKFSHMDPTTQFINSNIWRKIYVVFSMWTQYIYDENIVVSLAMWTQDPIFNSNFRQKYTSYVFHVYLAGQLINNNMWKTFRHMYCKRGDGIAVVICTSYIYVYALYLRRKNHHFDLRCKFLKNDNFSVISIS